MKLRTRQVEAKLSLVFPLPCEPDQGWGLPEQDFCSDCTDPFDAIGHSRRVGAEDGGACSPPHPLHD
eukprot:CAMPEP_0206480406 /NCGR_PEP_ID=MMETSP0324_2-20121206/37290_1 /ASSEMBLY_ACC=CAM_ASM_000836 /TAXON_ID=2866 /ORGANISM="Crypthecodinium cohnii, Strain Seligo" /LENGTH=66 /DNA_ID=CAMNT_0053957217 /DNA_START=259 /DNA_END=456 /DNA_ORIENTATION=-